VSLGGINEKVEHGEQSMAKWRSPGRIVVRRFLLVHGVTAFTFRSSGSVHAPRIDQDRGE
jgi:hypothetical protein